MPRYQLLGSHRTIGYQQATCRTKRRHFRYVWSRNKKIMTNRGLRNNPRFNKIQPYHTFCIRFIHLFFLRQVANPLWLVYPISLLVFRIESPRERDSFIRYKSLSNLLFCRLPRTDVIGLIERNPFEGAAISSSTNDQPLKATAARKPIPITPVLLFGFSEDIA